MYRRPNNAVKNPVSALRLYDPLVKLKAVVEGSEGDFSTEILLYSR